MIFVHGWGDFDTHENQANRHDDMMLQLDQALSGFFGIVDAAGRAGDVVVMTTSEFGRRVRDNGSGTDHGTASTSMLIGAPVVGGRYGQAVDLSRLDTRGNPAHTVDFRFDVRNGDRRLAGGRRGRRPRRNLRAPPGVLGTVP